MPTILILVCVGLLLLSMLARGLRYYMWHHRRCAQMPIVAVQAKSI